MSQRTQPPQPTKRGISLLEVIACLGLMSMMSIPMVGLMRSSIHAWDDHSLRNATEASAIDAARWISHRVQQSAAVTRVRSNRLELLTIQGTSEQLYLQGSDLILDDGSQRSVIASPLSALQFADQRGGSPIRTLGVQVTLTPAPSRPGFRAVPIEFLAISEWIGQ